MLPIRLDLPRLVQATAAALTLLALAAPGTAQAQAKLDARYTASLGGVTIGRGAWVIDTGPEDAGVESVNTYLEIKRRQLI